MKAIEARLGPCLFVEDTAGQVLPCVALPSNIPSVNQVFMSTCWTYCPFPPSISPNQHDGLLYKGFFELGSSIPLPSSKSLALRSRFISNGTLSKDLVLSIDFAYDNVTKRFRRACLPPKRSIVHLHGRLSRKTSLVPLKLNTIGILLELVSKRGSTVSIMLIDSEETRHTIATASLLRIGAQILVSDLKTSIVRPDAIRAIPHFLATVDTNFILLDEDETQEETQEERSKSKRAKLAETPESGILSSYSGLITAIYHSHCMELDEKYVVCAHRSEHGLGLLRKGSAVTLHFVHPIYEDKLLVGLGLCSHSTIEVLNFPIVYESPEYPRIEVQNRLGEFPCLEWALFVENTRLQLSKHCTAALSIGLYPFTEFLLNTELEKWRCGLFSHRNAYHEWFVHDSGSVGSDLGCRASGTISSVFPRLMSIEFFCNLRMLSPLDSRLPDWTCEVMNPTSLLEEPNDRVMIGRLVHQTREFQVLSNYVWFQSLNGLFQVPIVVTGLRIQRLFIPCRLKSFLVVKESTVPHYGESMGGFVKPRFSTPFGLYFVCDIDHIEFLWTPQHVLPISQAKQYNTLEKQDQLTFKLVRKNLPQYLEPHQGNTIFMDLGIVPSGRLPMGAETKEENGHTTMHLHLTNIHTMQLHPILREGSVYTVSNVDLIRGTKGSVRWECRDTLALTEISSPPFPPPCIAASASSSSSIGPAETNGEANLRTFLYKSCPLLKTSSSASVSFKAVIVARYHEPVLATSVSANGATRFLLGCETECRSNAGDAKLLLRALDSPDVVTAYFKTHHLSLPLGLVPGCVIAIKRAQLELKSKRKLSVTFGARYGCSSDIEIVGFDPSVCDALGVMPWKATSQLPRERGAGVGDLDSPSIPKLCCGPTGLRELLINKVDWLDPRHCSVPYRHLIDAPLTSAMDRRVFRTRVSLLKVFDFSLETCCLSCSRLSVRGTCTFGCDEKRMKLVTRLTGMFHDGTGGAKFSADGDHVWPLLDISTLHKNRLTSIVERVSCIRYQDRELTMPYMNHRSVTVVEDEEEEEPMATTSNDDDDDDDGLNSIQDQRSISTLRKVLINNMGDPTIVIGAYFASPREDELPFSDLPYIITKRKPSKEEPKDTASSSNMTISATKPPSIEQPQSKLTKPTPNVDVIWACKVQQVIKDECLSLLHSLYNM